MMISAVYDTNVLVSGTLLQSSHAPGQALDLVVQGIVKLYSSEPLIEEFRDVISRPKFASKFQAIGRTPDDLIADFRGMVEVIQPGSIPPTVKNDSKDDKVLACALYAGVDYIVSGDKKHLLPLGDYAGIPIVDPG
jgi:putative PIN family toxin of toxin-antitoxin system